MKILFLVDGHVLEMGGAELQAFALVKKLKSRGHEVEVVAPHLDRHSSQETTRAGARVRQLGYWRIPKLSSIFFMLRFALFLIVEGRRYDAIHIHMVHKMAAVTGLLRYFAPCPVVAKVSGAYEFADGETSSASRFVSLQYWLYKCVKRLDYFQAISSDTCSRLAQAGIPTEKILPIPNGVDTDHFKPSPVLHNGVDDSKTVIAYCGQLVPVKGLESLICAAELLEVGFGNTFEIRLHGLGELEEPLRQQVARLGLEEIVLFCGKADDVAKSLQGAHIYAQVSHYEGLSNAVLEAMSTGLPLVLSSVGGNKDVVTPSENGLLVEAGNAASIAEALASLIADRQLCRTLGENSRTLAERSYSLNSVANRLLCLYKDHSCCTKGAQQKDCLT